MQESQQIEASELSPVRRLDGEVTRKGGPPYSGGTYCEVWEGQWRKPGQGVIGGEVEGEMVSLSLATSISLTEYPVGGTESASRIQLIGRGVQGSTFCGPTPYHLLMSLSAVIRGSNVNFKVGQNYVIETSCRSTVRTSLGLSPGRFPQLYRNSHKYRTTSLHGEWATMRERTRNRSKFLR